MSIWWTSHDILWVFTISLFPCRLLFQPWNLPLLYIHVNVKFLSEKPQTVCLKVTCLSYTRQIHARRGNVSTRDISSVSRKRLGKWMFRKVRQWTLSPTDSLTQYWNTRRCVCRTGWIPCSKTHTLRLMALWRVSELEWMELTSHTDTWRFSVVPTSCHPRDTKTSPKLRWSHASSGSICPTKNACLKNLIHRRITLPIHV